MRTQEVQFYSEGSRVAALWRTPNAPRGQCRSIVQGPGWLGLKDAQLYVRYHEALTAAGFGVLIFDYRGFGGSEGEGTVSPHRQLQDLRNAVTSPSRMMVSPRRMVMVGRPFDAKPSDDIHPQR